MQQTLTPYQSLYYAWLLTRRAAGDSVESLASTLVDSQVDLNPHQVEAALFACANPLSRGVILADEVGLGKTIEAQTAHNYRETVTDLSKIKQMLFGGFSRCLYPLQKFDSDTERRFAVILERDALKWFKPAKGQFQIYYKLGSEQPEYIPDFVAETDSMILMVETKKRDDLSSDEVKSKAAAAVRWCSHASAHAATVGSKPWRYLLVPHDEIKESDRLTAFLRFELKA